MTRVTFTIGGWNGMDLRMMRELARQISGIDAIPASVTASLLGTASAGHATDEPPQPEPVGIRWLHTLEPAQA